MTSDRGTSEEAELQLSNVTSPVNPKSPGLNPNANVFQSKSPASLETTSTTPPWEELDNATSPTTTEDFNFINGDVNIVQVPGGVTYPPTPESPEHINQDYENMNGGVNVEVVFTPQETTPTVADETTPTLEAVNVEENQLKAMLKNQLEYYFSRENLANDSYLVSQMDADQYVPIATVANFNQVKRLTTDIDLVVCVLRESTNVQVDEKGEKVRPLHKRCIVILREIPDTTPLKDVQNLFSGENCPKFISCEFAHNNSWYVTFDSDEDAQRAYQYLREEVRCFLGKPIMARIKAKPLIRTSFIPKNGFKQQQQYNADSFNQQAQPQQMTQAMLPSPQQQTPQQTQQTQQQYPFATTHIPAAMPYMNGQHQQAYPFFPPNTVTHMWPNAPYFDPGMVFAANGYTAGTIKLNNAGGRHGFQNMRNRNQNKGSHRSNLERRGSFGDRTSGHGERHSSLGSSRTSPRSADNVHGVSRGRSSSETGSSMSSGIHSYHSTHTTPHTTVPVSAHVTGNSSQLSSTPSTSSTSALGHTSVPATSHHNNNHNSQPNLQSRHADSISSTSIASGNKDQPSQPQRRSTNFRSRRRREDEGAKISRPGSQSSTAKDPKGLSADSPKFDLEPTSFPPLPGSSNNTTAGDVFENKMSDVVKGTAKPLTRESKAPPPVSQAPPPVSQAPPSPVKETPPTIEAAPSPPTASVSSIPTPPATPQKENKTVSENSTKSTEPSPPEASSVTMPTPTSQPTEDKQPVKLSYAQMAQRAKERADGVNNNNTNNNGNESANSQPANTTNGTNGKSQALREQTQTVKAQPANMHSPVRDVPRKDRDDPKEQRHNPGRRAKENREWRERDKEVRGERVDRGERRRDRDREAPRTK